MTYLKKTRYREILLTCPVLPLFYCRILGGIEAEKNKDYFSSLLMHCAVLVDLVVN